MPRPLCPGNAPPAPARHEVAQTAPPSHPKARRRGRRQGADPGPCCIDWTSAAGGYSSESLAAGIYAGDLVAYRHYWPAFPAHSTAAYAAAVARFPAGSTALKLFGSGKNETGQNPAGHRLSRRSSAPERTNEGKLIRTSKGGRTNKGNPSLHPIPLKLFGSGRTNPQS
jgi:hypothetical protein